MNFTFGSLGLSIMRFRENSYMRYEKWNESKLYVVNDLSHFKHPAAFQMEMMITIFTSSILDIQMRLLKFTKNENISETASSFQLCFSNM